MQSELDRQAEIEAAAKQYPDLQVCLDDAVPGWCRFCTEQYKDAPRAEDRFKAAATGTALEFGLCSADHPEPWRALLESMRGYMRQRQWEGISIDSSCPPGPNETALNEYILQFYGEGPDPVRDPDAEEQARIRELTRAAMADGEVRRLRSAYECVTIRNVFSALADYRRMLAVSTKGKTAEPLEPSAFESEAAVDGADGPREAEQPPDTRQSMLSGVEDGGKQTGPPDENVFRKEGEQWVTVFNGGKHCHRLVAGFELYRRILEAGDIDTLKIEERSTPERNAVSEDDSLSLEPADLTNADPEDIKQVERLVEERAERLKEAQTREERENLVDEIAQLQKYRSGLADVRGKPRPAAEDYREKSRARIEGNLKKARNVIAEKDPALAKHLQQRIKVNRLSARYEDKPNTHWVCH